MNIAKKLFLTAVVCVAGYFGYQQFSGPDLEELGTQVGQMLQGQLDSNANLSPFHMSVKGVTLVHVEGNTYQGIANVDYHGASHQVSVNVVYDGKNIIFNAPPGSFAFVMQDAFN